jgi:type IV secretory pathway VirB2 component (pilin)
MLVNVSKFFVVIALIVMLLPVFSYAQQGAYGNGGGSGKGTVKAKPTIEEKLCDIRLVFCNSTAIALISFGVLFLGFMIFMGKLHWTMVIMTVAGMVIFVQAHNVTKKISNDPKFKVNQKCECKGTSLANGG